MPNNQVNYTNTTIHHRAPDAWHRLQLFNYFRGLLALFFITLYINDWLPQLIPAAFLHNTLYLTTSITYLVASIAFATSINLKKPGINKQVVVHALTDVSCIIILMHATGGIRFGLGMLLIISPSMASLFLRKRITILFASIAALAVIAEQLFSQATHTNYTPTFTQAGLLGILIFISTFLTIYITRKLKESERLTEQANTELETIIQMNEHIINNMRTGIIVIKNNGHVLMANNAALELLGNITVTAKTKLDEISTKLHERFIDWHNNAIQNHQPILQAQGLPDLQPGFSHIDHNINTTDNPSGRTLIFLEDATQLTQRFQQVKLASLGRLTASIAHEIRNPLAAINHAGQLLGETSTDSADKKLTNIINTQANRLNSIVENVLQLSRQQRGTPESINLQQWLVQFREEFIATNKLQAYQLQIQIKPTTIDILFDSSQLHQVMWNLCTNAINHTNMDSINMMIHIKGEIDVESNRPYIDIIDNGPGIDEDTQLHIFDPFFTTSSEGTGLGLYITKEVIESNRAKIRHISPPTGGTSFRIYFQQSQQIEKNK
ncbi:hypothetical protein MNBD_GAMMA05-2472 [hydrothermal vent metagenome]|uniref:Histidine kinase domain-containing protein n=1 Tax=hydrothermal vent metagenome TaxID=652676 RepID=A0A3B0WXL3_9ZZZZ